MEKHHPQLHIGIRIIAVKILLIVLSLFNIGLEDLAGSDINYIVGVVISLLILWQLFKYVREVHQVNANWIAFWMIVVPIGYFLIIHFAKIEAVTEYTAYFLYTLPSGIQSVGVIMFSLALMSNKASESFREAIEHVGITYLISEVAGMLLPYLLGYSTWVSSLVAVLHLLPLFAILRLYRLDLTLAGENNQ